MSPYLLRCALLWLLASGPMLAAETRYRIGFDATLLPGDGQARVTIEVKQGRYLLREMEFVAPESRYTGFSGDGEIARDGSRISWLIPEKGGELSYIVSVDHKRGRSYDARLTPKWALLRLDDLFPPPRTRTLKGAESRSTLSLSAPNGWYIETRYGPYQQPFEFDEPAYRLDRPSGWMIAGKLGIRRGLVAERQVAIAAPPGQGMRRLDILAFLRWTLPQMTRVFTDFPARLLIAGASDGMWRGGLSGPDSLYLHPDRPLISENGTSTLMHELAHVAIGLPGHTREDWLMEGLAEYYSLEVLRRSGGISQKRFDSAIESLSDWARREKAVLKSPSKGATTARSVVLLDALADELREAGVPRLDGITRSLLKREVIDGTALVEVAEKAMGQQSKVLRKALADHPDVRFPDDSPGQEE